MCAAITLRKNLYLLIITQGPCYQENVSGKISFLPLPTPFSFLALPWGQIQWLDSWNLQWWQHWQLKSQEKIYFSGELNQERRTYIQMWRRGTEILISIFSPFFHCFSLRLTSSWVRVWARCRQLQLWQKATFLGNSLRKQRSISLSQRLHLFGVHSNKDNVSLKQSIGILIASYNDLGSLNSGSIAATQTKGRCNINLPTPIPITPPHQERDRGNYHKHDTHAACYVLSKSA